MHDAHRTPDFVAVDLGNTSVKFGAFAGGSLVSVERITVPRSMEEDVIPPPPLFSGAPVVVLASSPRRAEEFGRWCPSPFRMLGDDVRADLRSTYADAAELGLDRVAACAGGRALAGGAAVVAVSAGTALTADAMDASGRFLALAIAPGLRAAADGLHDAAPHLPAADVSPGRAKGPSRGSADSMRYGHLVGAAGAADRLASDAAALLAPSAPAAWFLCGGDAAALAPHCRTPFRAEPDLVLHGIRALAGEVSR